MILTLIHKSIVRSDIYSEFFAGMKRTLDGKDQAGKKKAHKDDAEKRCTW